MIGGININTIIYFIISGIIVNIITVTATWYYGFYIQKIDEDFMQQRKEKWHSLTHSYMFYIFFMVPFFYFAMSLYMMIDLTIRKR